jgi:cell division protein FtsB
MRERVALLPLVRRAAVPALALALVGYFGFHSIGGNTGILAWQDYKAERAALEKQAAATAQQKAALQKQVALLDPRKVDPDLADELVRKNLGVVRPDEVIVDLPEDGK